MTPRTVRRPEWPLVLKTRSDLFGAMARRIAELHPYETPAITVSAPDHVSDAYAAWIEEETSPPEPGQHRSPEAKSFPRG